MSSQSHENNNSIVIHIPSSTESAVLIANKLQRKNVNMRNQEIPKITNGDVKS